MTECIFTPGPWAVEVWQNDGEIARRYSIVSKAEKGESGPESVLSGITWYDSPRDCANAHLIAAAPALLEALEAFCRLEVKDHALIDRLQFSEEGRALSAKINAALSEAKGLAV